MADAYRTRLYASPDAIMFAGYAAFNNAVVDATNDGCAVIMQATSADAITHVGFRYGARTGTPPTFIVALESVDGSGNPTGTVLGGGSPASATFTPPADATWDGTWRKITLNNSYTPARGDVFAITIRYSSGTIDGSNNSTFSTRRSGTNATSLFPTVRLLSGGTWSASGSATGIVGAYYTAGGCVGMPLETLQNTSYTSASTPDEYALCFTLPSGWGSTYQVVGIYAAARMDAGSSVDITLYSGTTALQTLTMDGDVSTAAFNGPKEMYFADAALTALDYGTTYRIGFTPTVGTAYLYCYEADGATEAAGFGGGGNFYLSTRTDAGAWSDDTTKRPLVDLILADITEPSGGGGLAGSIFGGQVVR